MIRFLELPGIQRLEDEMMIAHKFHQDVAQFRIDDVSYKLFGITRYDVRYPLPGWFVDGFRNYSDWENSGDDDIGPHYAENAFYDDKDLFCIDVDDGVALRRKDVRAGALAFWNRMKPAQGVSDPYEMMDVSRSFGFDFSDRTGTHPLRITSYFFLQALAAASGAAGSMPDVQELEAGEWAAKLEIDARNFKRGSR